MSCWVANHQYFYEETRSAQNRTVTPTVKNLALVPSKMLPARKSKSNQLSFGV